MKTLYVILIAIIAVSSIGGTYLYTTTLQSTPESNVVTVYDMWSSAGELQAIESIIENFEDKTGIKVVHTPGPEPYDPIVLTSLAGGNPPDVFQWFAPERAFDLQRKGYIQDYQDIWDREQLSTQYSEAEQKLMFYEGKPYAQLIGLHSAWVWYNTHIFEENSLTIPETWDEFVALCKTIKETLPGVNPISLGYKYRYPLDIFFTGIVARAVGPDHYAKLMDGTASWQDPKVLVAFEAFVEILPYLDPSGPEYDMGEQISYVMSGKAAMSPTGDWFKAMAEQGGLGEPYVDFDCFPIPTINPEVSENIIPSCSADCLLIAKDSANTENAKEFIAYIASAEAQALFAPLKGATAPNLGTSLDIYDPMARKIAEAVYNADDIVVQMGMMSTGDKCEAFRDLLIELVGNPSRMLQIAAGFNEVYGYA